MSTPISLPPQYDLVRLASVPDVVAAAVGRARAGAEEGTLIWAGEQTRATTRGGVPWASPAGNLHAALVLRPECERAQSHQMLPVMMVSLAATLPGLLAPMTGIGLGWPNRVFINDLPAGRLHLAAGGTGDDHDWLVVGVMLNVAHHPAQEALEAFSSVHASGSPEVDDQAALESLFRHFLAWINRWAEEGMAPIMAEWRRRDAASGWRPRPGLERAELLEVEDDGGAALRLVGGEVVLTSVGRYFGLD